MLQSAVSLLAGIPSVVYGLVGMLVLVPGIRRIFGVPDGAGLMAAIIVLAVMILPSIIKMSVTALDAVAKEQAALQIGRILREFSLTHMVEINGMRQFALHIIKMILRAAGGNLPPIIEAVFILDLLYNAYLLVGSVTQYVFSGIVGRQYLCSCGVDNTAAFYGG